MKQYYRVRMLVEHYLEAASPEDAGGEVLQSIHTADVHAYVRVNEVTPARHKKKRAAYKWFHISELTA